MLDVEDRLIKRCGFEPVRGFENGFPALRIVTQGLLGLKYRRLSKEGSALMGGSLFRYTVIGRVSRGAPSCTGER